MNSSPRAPLAAASACFLFLSAWHWGGTACWVGLAFAIALAHGASTISPTLLHAKSRWILVPAATTLTLLAWICFPAIPVLNMAGPRTCTLDDIVLVRRSFGPPNLAKRSLIAYRIHPWSGRHARVDPGLGIGTVIAWPGDVVTARNGAIDTNGTASATPFPGLPDFTLAVPHDAVVVAPVMRWFHLFGDEADAALRDALPSIMIVNQRDIVGDVIARRQGWTWSRPRPSAHTQSRNSPTTHSVAGTP